MRVGGIIDISTKDIPGRSSMVIFTVGCNLKCTFCHNKYLLNLEVGKETTVNDIIDQVKSNLLVSGVSITGGEPTLQKDLLELCKEIKKIGRYISIDTNGTNPEIIKELIPYIDRIALDLKGPLKKNRIFQITNKEFDLNLIKETIDFVNRQKKIDFEIRTTYVGQLMKPIDIHKIISFLSKHKFRDSFVLQQYQYSEGVGKKYKEIYFIPEHITLFNILKKYKNFNLPFKIFIRDNVVGYMNLNLIEED